MSFLYCKFCYFLSRNTQSDKRFFRLTRQFETSIKEFLSNRLSFLLKMREVRRPSPSPQKIEKKTMMLLEQLFHLIQIKQTNKQTKTGTRRGWSRI